MVSIPLHIPHDNATPLNHTMPQNECLTAQDWLARFQRNEGRFNGCSEYPSESSEPLQSSTQFPLSCDHFFHRLG